MGERLSGPRTIMLDRPGRSFGDGGSDRIVRRIAASLDPVALGAALAVVFAAVLLAATMILVLRSGPQVGPHLGLLAQYFPGYRVTAGGSIVGALYGAAVGFLCGWATAHLRNLFLKIYLWMIRIWANLSRTYFLDRFD